MPESVWNRDFSSRITSLCFLILRFPHQNERGPVIGMWKSRLNFDNRFLDRTGFGEPVLKALIEATHELSGGPVVDSPQTDDKRWSASVKKSAREPQQFVTFPDLAHSCFAGAQGGQLGAELKIENVEQIQPAIAKSKRGKHRIVRSENAMSGDVDFPGRRAVLTQLVHLRLA